MIAESAQLIRCYWYLIARNPLWLLRLLLAHHFLQFKQQRGDSSHPFSVED